MAARRERYSPSGPFVDGGGDGTSSIYSVADETVITTEDTSPLSVLDWAAPETGTYLVHWQMEVTSNADGSTDPLNVGSASLEANSTEQAAVAIIVLGDDAPNPYYQLSGFLVVELDAAQTLELFIQAADLEAVTVSARRRRFAIFPVTLLT